jgi:hypothetical protein
LRLTVATGDRSLREAAEKLPVSLTATIIDIASRRSICPFFQFSEKLLLNHTDCALALQSDSNGSCRTVACGRLPVPEEYVR